MAAQGISTRTLIIVISLSAIILAGTGISIWLGVTHTPYTPPLVETDHPDQEWEMMITGLVDGGDFNISIQELLNMPQHWENYLIESDPAYTANFSGVKIQYLFETIIEIDPTATSVAFVAWDGYSFGFALDSNITHSSNILALQKNGQFLENYPEGNGYLRLIVHEDSFVDPNSQYCVKNILEIRFS